MSHEATQLVALTFSLMRKLSKKAREANAVFRVVLMLGRLNDAAARHDWEGSGVDRHFVDRAACGRKWA